MANEGVDLEEGGVRELHRLLEDLRFSARKGAYAAGPTVSVTIDPVVDRQVRLLHVNISYRALGFRVFEWTGHAMRVNFGRKGQDNKQQIRKLNADGNTTVVLPLDMGATGSLRVVTQQPLSKALAAGDVDSGRFISPDGTLIAVLTRTGAGLTVKFQFTQRANERFERAKVWWAFLAGGRIIKEKTLDLNQDDSPELKKEELSEDVIFVFDVVHEEQPHLG